MADQILRQGHRVVRQIRLMDALPLPAVLQLHFQHPTRRAVGEHLQHLIFPRQGQHLREAPPYSRMLARHRPQDGRAPAALPLHRAQQAIPTHILRVPVPGTHDGLLVRLKGLVLPDAVLRRVAAGDQRGVSRVGQSGEDRLHLRADSGLPQPPGKEGILSIACQIPVKHRVQRKHNHPAHDIFLRIKNREARLLHRRRGCAGLQRRV